LWKNEDETLKNYFKEARFNLTISSFIKAILKGRKAARRAAKIFIGLFTLADLGYSSFEAFDFLRAYICSQMSALFPVSTSLGN
jgi:hypothetical protein